MKFLLIKFWLLTVTIVQLTACGENNWNNPYAASDTGKNILYSVFTERPKHLDPVPVSYTHLDVYKRQILISVSADASEEEKQLSLIHI